MRVGRIFLFVPECLWTYIHALFEETAKRRYIREAKLIGYLLNGQVAVLQVSCGILQQIIFQPVAGIFPCMNNKQAT